MRCPTPPPRTFLLELLEGVLSQRYDVFRRLPQMTVALRQRVGEGAVYVGGGADRVCGRD